jgi:hypothetical protein
MGAFTTLAIVGGVSTLFSAGSQIKAGGQAKKAGELEQQAANAQADLSDWNAKVADLQAEDAIQRGAEEEARLRRGVRQLVGAQRAGFAADGVDVGFGSALDVQADTAEQGELDALTIRTNAAREAWGFKVEAQDLRYQAGIMRRTGVAAAASGRARQTQQRLGGASTVLGGTTDFLKLKYGFR